MRNLNITFGLNRVLKTLRSGGEFHNYNYALTRFDSSKDTFLLQPFLNGIRGGGYEISVYKARKLVKNWLAGEHNELIPAQTNSRKSG